jgi:hypothetical protein
VVSAPGVIQPHLSGEAELYVLGADEGGRHTPFASGYTPQFFFGATDVNGTLTVPDDGVVEPGRGRGSRSGWGGPPASSRACASPCVKVATPSAPVW